MTCPDLPKSRILSSELPIKGLKRDYTLLHITDVHMTLIEETQSAQRKDTARDRGNVLFTEDGIPAHERFAAFFSYAEAIGADLILMTGDIIEKYRFSEKNDPNLSCKNLLCSRQSRLEFFGRLSFS